MTNRPSHAANTPPSTGQTKCPLLLEAERSLLKQHQGCFKCRKFYIGHTSQSCPYGFPNGTNYKPLSDADALAAKVVSQRARTTTAPLP